MSSNNNQLKSSGVGFIPPKPTPAIVKVCQTFWPEYARISEFHLSVELDQSIRDAFRVLEGQRAVICGNHSAHDDPLVAFALSAALKQEFYFLTAREIFMWHPSLRSLWLQHIGCYSVMRASADIEAYKTTCRLLEEPHKIVIFPEGEVTHQNRFVLNLQQGPQHMALAVSNRLQDTGTDEPVFLLPIGIVYRYTEDIVEQLLITLAHQEQKLGLSIAAGMNVGDRLQAAYGAMFSVLESEFHCHPQSDWTLAQRIHGWIDRVIEETAAYCSVSVPSNLTQRDRVHYVKNCFTNRRYTSKDAPSSDMDRLLYNQLRRATNFIGLQDVSFSELPDQDALAELVLILEYEVSGTISIKAKRRAYIGAADPIDVRPLNAVFRSNKSIAIGALSDTLRSGIATTIERLRDMHPGFPLKTRRLYV